MSIQVRRRNNFIAGIFVILTIMVAIVVIWWLSGRSFGSQKHLQVFFPMDLGVPGLAVGSEVSIGNFPVGKVTAIKPDERVEPSGRGGILVTLSIPQSYDVRSQATVELIVPLLGSGAVVNIYNLSRGEVLTEEALLIGSLAPPSFFNAEDINSVVKDLTDTVLERAGLGEEQRTQVQQIIARVDQFSKRADELLAFGQDWVDKDGPTLRRQVNQTLDNVSDMAARAEPWMESIDRSLANFEATTARGPELADSAAALMENIDGGVTDVRETVALVTPDIEVAAENAAAISTKFRYTTLDNLDFLLTRAADGVDSFTAALDRIDAWASTRLPEVSTILGNLRIASNYFKLASIEIRAQPWRVLYEPSRRELRESELQDAVRTYANAASDLNSASTALVALHDRYGRDLDASNPVIRQAVASVVQQLDQRRSQYKEAEDRLFKVLLGEADLAGG